MFSNISGLHPLGASSSPALAPALSCDLEGSTAPRPVLETLLTSYSEKPREAYF